PATPSCPVAGLEQLIATDADEPELAGLAGLAQPEEHLRRFGQLLDAAIEDGWAAQNLGGEELFELYAFGGQFRAELHATAGVAAYTAARADPTLPADAYLAEAVIPPRRQQILAKAITDHAPRCHATVGSPARYIAEGHVPGGATSAEWNWIAYHIAAHPDVLHGPVLSPADVDARNRALADQYDRQASAAFEAGNYQRALEFVDDAELHDPHREWDAIRTRIRTRTNQPGPVASESGGPPAGDPGAGTAFPHPRHIPGEH